MNQPFTIRLAGPITDTPRHIHGTATQLADAGGNLAADYAARLTGRDWKAAAESFALGFIRQRGTCQCSDVREAARGTFLDHEGIDPRAWGAVFRSLVRAGKIRSCGHRVTDRKLSHGRPEMVWQYVEA